MPENKLPLEARLLNCLRVWSKDPSAVLDDGQDVEREIYSLLEWYICECIRYGPANLGGWWSDGVVHLEISQPESDKFILLGVTWIDCHGIVPFEIDLEMDPCDDNYFAKTTFRIGTLDDQGHPRIFDRDHSASRLLERRPRCNREWAMAVEITPPNDRDKTKQ